MILDKLELDYISIIEDFEYGNISKPQLVRKMNQLKSEIQFINEALYNCINDKRYTFLIQILKREFKSYFFKDFYDYFVQKKMQKAEQDLNIICFKELSKFSSFYYNNLYNIDNLVVNIFKVSIDEKFKKSYKDLYLNNFESIKYILTRNLANKDYQTVNNFIYSLLKNNIDNNLAEFIKNTIIDNLDNHKMIDVCAYEKLGKLLEQLVNKDYYTEFFDNLVRKNDPDYLHIIYLLEQERFMVNYKKYLVNNALFIDIEFHKRITLFMELSRYENLYQINRMLAEIENKKIIDSNLSMVAFSYVPWKTTKKDISFPGKEMIEKQFNDNNKTLIWNENLIFGTIEINGIDVTMTLPMVNIVLQFNDHDQIPYNKKCAATYHLIKNKILVINKAKQIVKINSKFSCQNKRFTIQNTPIKKKSNNPFAVFKAKSQIIRLMKKERELTTDKIKRHLKIDEKIANKLIAELSKDEYIKIKDDIVTYIP